MADAPLKRHVSWAIVLFATLGLGLGLALAARSRVNIWIFTGAVALVILIAAWYAVPERFSEWFRFRGGSISWGIATGLAFVVLTHLGVRLAIGLDARVASMIRELYEAVNFPSGPREVFPVVMLVAAMEEVVWRGLVVDLLRPRGEMFAASVAVVLYALPQAASGSLPLFAGAVVGGALWTLLRLWRDDLVTPLVSHLVWSASLFVLAPLPV